MPKISILTPFKNAESYIWETAQSIFNQVHTNWEWILINDHSTQREKEVLHAFLNDPRVFLIENKGVGIADALVTGLEISSGEYITRMDADDCMPTYKLNIFLDCLIGKKADLVTGKVQYFSADGCISKGYLAYENWLNAQVNNQDFYNEIYRECTVASGNWLISKEKLLECGGFKGLNYPEDYDLLFRWYQKNYKIIGIDKVTHLWREHDSRTSKNSDLYGQESFFQLKLDYFLKLEHNNCPIVVNGTGQKGRLTSRILLNNQISFDWVSKEPERFRAGVYGKEIKAHHQIRDHKRIKILNCSTIDTKSVHQLYSKDNDGIEIFTL